MCLGKYFLPVVAIWPLQEGGLCSKAKQEGVPAMRQKGGIARQHSKAARAL